MCSGRQDARTNDLRTGLLLANAEVRLAANSLLPGYCVVAWSGRHVSESFELAPEESAAYWHDVELVAQAINSVFAPMKINLMTLGNWVPHLHTHVVPRYVDDPAPGDPIAYADMFSPDADDPEVFSANADRLGQAIRSASQMPWTSSASSTRS
ncbi:MAG TPA: HIT family protein [Mycobacteriales bacterium]|jgi:diadenosine tetraphosphate (Ap4A) HIT family hydrolase|nr:HIT family protein [Mycobacteriales bacterium]